MDAKWIILLPFLLAFVVMRRDHMFSIRNVSVFGFHVMLVLGVFLLPNSIEVDKFTVLYPQQYEDAINKSIIAATIALGAYCGAFLLLDKIDLRASGVTSRYERVIDEMFSAKFGRTFPVFALLGVVAAATLVFVFIEVGHIPYANLHNPAKYFDGYTNDYIKLRPLYVMAQQLLAVSGIFILLFLFSSNKRERFAWAGLLIFNTLVLVLTLKRGEIFLPFVVLFGGVLFGLKKIDKRKCLYLLFAVVFLFVGAVLTEPSGKYRPFTTQINQALLGKDVAPANDSREGGMLSAPVIAREKRAVNKVVTDFFGVQIRETSRLIYNFDLMGQPYYYGKTFIAGIIGFLPTQYCSFKENYLISRVVLSLFEQDKETSGGPRVGIIGEGYINFDFLGVAIASTVLACIAWYLDRVQRRYFDERVAIGLPAMTGLFFVFFHLVWGGFLDGSAAVQTFMIRALLILAISFLLRGKAFFAKVE